MKAFVVEKVGDDEFKSSIQNVETPKCEKNEVVIKVTYSSLNYKDALSSVGNPGVSKHFPHITGIDVAGVIEKSNSAEFKVGEKVLVTGYDMGMNSNGGHAQFVKIPASWVARIPDAISDREIMTFGTAGLTAALSVNELIENGIKPESGDILVTGATGGVGSIAIAILSKLGYNITAISGKKERIDFLKKIGVGKNVDTIIALEEDDATNLSIVLGARMLDPNIQIITLVNESEVENKLKLAGADFIVNSNQISAYVASEYIGQPVAFEAVDGILLEGDMSAEVNEIEIVEGMNVINKNINARNINEFYNEILNSIENTYVKW
mgnify:CR=1 FL=1